MHEEQSNEKPSSKLPGGGGDSLQTEETIGGLPLPQGQHSCCGERLRPFWADDGRLISVCRHCGKEYMDPALVRYGGAPWIGVDLDGTLAEDLRGNEEAPFDEIGRPITPMLNRVRSWLAEGRTVKIFTARASVSRQVELVKRWLHEHGLPDLEVTNVKDFGMIELWDDRCIQVVHNSGDPVNSASVVGQAAKPRRNRGPRGDGKTGLLAKIRMYLAL